MPRARRGSIEWDNGRAVAVLSVTIDGKRTRPRYDLGTTDPEIAQKKLEQLLRKVPAVEVKPKLPRRRSPSGPMHG